MGVIVPSYPLQLNPNTTQGLVYAGDSSTLRRTFGSDTGDIADLCGNSPAATRSGTNPLIGGPYGQALSYDGSSSYTSLGDTAALRVGTGDFSISGRFLATALPSTGTVLLSKDYTGIEIYNYASTLRAYIGGASNGINGSRVLSINVWYTWHLVRKSGVCQIYINGIADGSPVTNTASGSNPGQSFLMGNRPGASDWFSGYQYPPRISTRSFSPNEVAIDTANPNRIFRQWRNWAAMLGTKPSGSSLLLAC
jgi:hypothetical protein